MSSETKHGFQVRGVFSAAFFLGLILAWVDIIVRLVEAIV